MSSGSVRSSLLNAAAITDETMAKKQSWDLLVKVIIAIAVNCCFSEMAEGEHLRQVRREQEKQNMDERIL